MANKKNNAYLPNLEPFWAAGIDPKTGLPVKLEPLACLDQNILKNLRILDETQKVNLYKWYNLPSGIDGNLIERILYYKGQAAFWFNTIDGQFYFLPFALNGSIDVYGRYTGITPLPFNGTAKDKEDAWIVDLIRVPQYDIFDPEISNKKETACVILRDYTQQISQTVLPRASLDDPILKMMSEAIPFARTSLLSNSGIKAMRVNDESDANEVYTASRSVVEHALAGEPFVPIKSQIEFQELTSSGSAMKSEEYLLYYQALDNLRKSFLGIPAGGVFEKQSHTLQSEQDMNSNSDNLILEDGLELRQKFCQMVNAIWGLGIWCEKNQDIEDQEDDNQVDGEGNQNALDKGGAEEYADDNE